MMFLVQVGYLVLNFHGFEQTCRLKKGVRMNLETLYVMYIYSYLLKCKFTPNTEFTKHLLVVVM